MRNWLRFTVSGVVVLATAAALLSAQIAVPFPSFTIDTTINPDEVNANFAKFGDAVNRTGGTMTGALVTLGLTPALTATYDLGLTGTRYKDGWFSGNLTAGGTVTGVGAGTFASVSSSGAGSFGSVSSAGAGTFASVSSAGAGSFGSVTASGAGAFASTSVSGLGAFGTASTSNTGASSLDVGGGINAGTGNVGIVDATGKIPALSSTYFASTTTPTAWAFSGGVSVGGGSTLLSVVTGSTTSDPAVIGAASSASVTLTVTGASTTSTCFGSHSGIGTLEVALTVQPSAANAVTVFYRNNNPGVSADIANGTLRVVCLNF